MTRTTVAALALLAGLGAGLLYRAGLGMGPHAFTQLMLAHLLLSLGAAPLLVLAWPRRVPALPGPLVFVLYNAVLFGLHRPASHAALMTPWGLGLEGALFTLSGVLYWARVARGGTGAVLLLLAQMLACTLLGAAITFSHGLYAGVSPDDTALGGVLMWMVGGLVVMAAALHGLLSLLRAEGNHTRERHEPAA